jgi:hypothetical protein
VDMLTLNGDLCYVSLINPEEWCLVGCYAVWLL